MNLCAWLTDHFQLLSALCRSVLGQQHIHATMLLLLLQVFCDSEAPASAVTDQSARSAVIALARSGVKPSNRPSQKQLLKWVKLAREYQDSVENLSPELHHVVGSVAEIWIKTDCDLLQRLGNGLLRSLRVDGSGQVPVAVPGVARGRPAGSAAAVKPLRERSSAVTLDLMDDSEAFSVPGTAAAGAAAAVQIQMHHDTKVLQQPAVRHPLGLLATIPAKPQSSAGIAPAVCAQVGSSVPAGNTKATIAAYPPFAAAGAAAAQVERGGMLLAKPPVVDTAPVEPAAKPSSSAENPARLAAVAPPARGRQQHCHVMNQAGRQGTLVVQVLLAADLWTSCGSCQQSHRQRQLLQLSTTPAMLSQVWMKKGKSCIKISLLRSLQMICCRTHKQGTTEVEQL